MSVITSIRNQVSYHINQNLDTRLLFLPSGLIPFRSGVVLSKLHIELSSDSDPSHTPRTAPGLEPPTVPLAIRLLTRQAINLMYPTENFMSLQKKGVLYALEARNMVVQR